MIQKIILHNPSLKILRQTQFIAAGIIFAYFALSSSPTQTITTPPYVLHFIGNVLLIMSAWLAFLNRLSLWKTLLVAITYSILIELAQGMTRTRHADISDIAVNLLGIAAGFAICYPVDHWLKKVD